jgi:hypothetical protein
MVMRRTLGSLSLATVLAAGVLTAGCGDERGATADDSASPISPTASGTPSATGQPQDETVDFKQVALVSMTGGGGRASTRAVLLEDEADVGRFASQFRAAALGNQLREAVRNAGLPDDGRLYGAVVSIGCDVPPGVTVTSTASGIAIEPKPVASPLQECLAPVTTVALVTVASGGDETSGAK